MLVKRLIVKARVGKRIGEGFKYIIPIICLIYILYFDSKSLALAERNESVSFYDYVGPFFLLWFFPIGIWIIQPKINRLYVEKT
jgi:hypothetical protein